jgi:LysR family transcriptional regulator, regulator for bpeEF and oprC
MLTKSRLSERILGLEEFMAVAQAGSFVAASERLGLTSSGVGKAVAKLEARLGIRLFLRTTRKVSLTDDGQALLLHTQRLLTELEDAEATLDRSTAEVSGRLRVGAPVAYGRLKLIHYVCKFQQLHPAVELDLRLSDRIADTTEERLDLVIRIGELDDSSMWARRIDTIEFAAFAAPSYLKKYPTIAHPSDLEKHARLGFVRGSGRLLDFQFAKLSDRITLSPTRHLQCSDAEGVLQAAIAGLGVAYLPSFLAQAALEQGLVQTVLPEWAMPGPPVHLLYPHPRNMPKRVRALADFF